MEGRGVEGTTCACPMILSCHAHMIWLQDRSDQIFCSMLCALMSSQVDKLGQQNHHFLTYSLAYPLCIITAVEVTPAPLWGSSSPCYMHVSQQVYVGTTHW